jgi:hypothetical protein
LALSLAWAIRCMRHSLGFGAFNHFWRKSRIVNCCIVQM